MHAELLGGCHSFPRECPSCAGSWPIPHTPGAGRCLRGVGVGTEGTRVRVPCTVPVACGPSWHLESLLAEFGEVGTAWRGEEPPQDLSAVPADGPRPRTTACPKECVPWANQHCRYLIVCLLTQSRTVQFWRRPLNFQVAVLRQVKKKKKRK